MTYRLALALVIVGCSVEPANEHGDDGEHSNFDRAAWWKRVTTKKLIGTTRTGQDIYTHGGPVCGRLGSCRYETAEQRQAAASVPRTCGRFMSVPGDMLKPRVDHAAIEVTPGRVLVLGGYDIERRGESDYWFVPSETAELRSVNGAGWQVRDDLHPPGWDGMTGAWFEGNSFEMIKLHNGEVVFAGGSFIIQQMVESYVLDTLQDEADWQWTRIGDVSGPDEHIRFDYSTSAWGASNERAVVAGGVYFVGPDVLPYDDTRILDAAHRSWSKGPNLIQPRVGHAAVTMQGAVVLLGGATMEGLTGSIERLRVDGTSWEAVGELIRPRMSHDAVQLSAQEVLVVGGEIVEAGSGELVVTASTEIVNLSTGASAEAAPMPEALIGFGLSRLPSGHILLTGGDSGLEGADELRARAYLFDVNQRRWLRINGEQSSPRAGHTPVNVANTVMLTGGVAERDDNAEPIYTASSEIFSPGSCTNHLPFVGR